MSKEDRAVLARLFAKYPKLVVFREAARLGELVPKKKPGKKRSPNTPFNNFEAHYYADKARKQFGVGINEAARMVAEQWGEIAEASRRVARNPEKVRKSIAASTVKHAHDRVRKALGKK